MEKFIHKGCGADMVNIRKLEAELWDAADQLRANSKLTSNQYCMPVLGLIFLRYAYSRFKLVEKEILKDRPMRNGRAMPVEASDSFPRALCFFQRRHSTNIWSIFPPISRQQG